MERNLIECSNRRLTKQKCRKWVPAGLAIFLTITIFVVLTVHKPKNRGASPTVPSKNITIIQSSSENPNISCSNRKRNESVLHPCDDFYEYACQSWHMNNPPPENKTEWDVFHKLYSKEIELVSGILDESIHEDDLPFLNEAKEFFRQCLTRTHKDACVEGTRLLFWWSLTHEIALRKYKSKKEYDVRVREPVLEIFHNIKNSLEEMSLPLYSNTTPCIGMPEWIFDHDSVQATYKGYSNGTHWVQQRYSELIIEQIFGITTSSRIGDLDCQWIEQPSSAYYKRNSNVSQTLFPYIILQSPYFDTERSSAQNYGALGARIGHELAHAYTNYYWHLPKDERMSTFTDCLKNQFSAFTLELSNKSINLDGERTAKENFADYWGLRGAYHAYDNLDPNENDVLFKISFKLSNLIEIGTRDQQFFLSFAQSWCGSPSNEGLMDTLTKDNHSPVKLRVLGTLQNFPEFSEAFSCPLGSPMNPCPESKCLF